MPQLFNTSSTERLSRFLSQRKVESGFEKLTPDASTRAYFRIRLGGKSLIACLYSETFDQSLPQIDITNLFLACGLPVAEIVEIDYDLGLILHEDFGDLIFRDVLESADQKQRDALIDGAISLIARIQEATEKAFEIGSIASKLRFDQEKLSWELEFFRKHYFESLKKSKLDPIQNEELDRDFTELSSELSVYSRVLTHRDFHSANLMVDSVGEIKIIDHQDARLGSAAYDLVSLLLDRIDQPPSSEWLDNKIRRFLSEREKLGLAAVKPADFDYEFDLVTIQRCLKAIGTFSNQAANFGKQQYVRYIDPMFTIVGEACRKLDKYPAAQRIIGEILK